MILIISRGRRRGARSAAGPWLRPRQQSRQGSAAGLAPRAATASISSKQDQACRRVRRRRMQGGGGAGGCGCGVAARPTRDHTRGRRGTTRRLNSSRPRCASSRVEYQLSRKRTWRKLLGRFGDGRGDVVLIYFTEGGLTHTSNARLSILQAKDVFIGRHTT